MKLQILEDLYNEVNRLFIAGAKFAPNDPRVSRLVPVLEKTGEKSPVIKKLAELVSRLASCQSAEAPQALMETGIFLYAVLNTQTESGPEEGRYPEDSFAPAPAGLPEFAGELPVTKTSYRNLKPVIEALTESKSGRLDVLKTAYENGMTGDFRLYPLYSSALADKYSEVAELVFEKIIPAAGRPMIPFLLDDYDPKGRKPDARRLSLLHSLGCENACDLAAQAIADNASDDIQIAATGILKDKAENEELLLSLAGGKKADIREAALLALVEMDSEKGKKLLLETLQSGKYECALKAAQACKDGGVVREIIAYAKTAYKDCKENDKKKKEAARAKFEALVGVFLYREEEEECIIGFCKEICADSENSKTLERHVLNRIAGRYFYVAAKSYSPEEVYGTFIGLYTNDVLQYHANLSPVAGSVFDKRWLSAFIAKNDAGFLCLVMKPEDTEAVRFLVHYLEEGIRSKQPQVSSDRCVEKLIEIGYKGLDKIVFAVFENCKGDSYFWPVFAVVSKQADKVFSRDYIKKLEALVERTKNYYVADIARKLKEAYGVE